MCRPASFVLTNDRVFWSKNTDSHEDIVAEFELQESGARGIQILRVEIAPDDGDLARPPREWVFGYDQDMLPDWADKAKDERRTRKALAEWRTAKLFVRGEHSVHAGIIYALGSARVVARDSARVVARGSARVVARNSASVHTYAAGPVVELKSPHAVHIDRSGSRAKCTVGQ